MRDLLIGLLSGDMWLWTLVGWVLLPVLALMGVVNWLIDKFK